MTTIIPSFGFKAQYSNGLKGLLTKRGHVMKNWKQRYFVLSGYELKYYTDETCTQLQGGYLIKPDSLLNSGDFEGKKYSISLEAERLDSRKMEILHICASNSEERDNWYNALDETVHGGFHSINQPDVWSPFYPSLELGVKYNKTTQVTDGNLLLPSEAKNAPDISFSVLKDPPTDVYYTLVMFNSDHASQGNLLVPRQRYLHWAVLNIQYNEIAKGNHIVKYQGPAPFKGSNNNRFFFLLFRQDALFNLNQINTAVVEKRDGFSLSRWALDLNLGDPIAINGFYAAHEPSYCENWLHSSFGMISISNTSEPPALPASPNGNGHNGSQKSSPTARRPSVEETAVDRQVELLAKGIVTSPLQRRLSKDEETINKQVELLTKVMESPQRRASKELSEEERLDSMVENMIQKNPEVPSVLKKFPRLPGTPKKNVTFLICNPALMSDPQPVTSSFYDNDGEDTATFEDSVSDYQINYDNNNNNNYLNGNMVNGSPVKEQTKGSDLSLSIAAVSAVDSTPEGSPSPHLSPLLPPTPMTRRTSSSNSIDPNSPGIGSNRSLVPLMQRVALASDPEGFCTVFGVSTRSIFEGVTMRKKFSKDLIMKESFVWIDPTSKSIHWAKSSTEKNVTHKHILLDKNSSYTVIEGSSPSGSPTNQAYQKYTKQAGGTQMGVIKGAELEDLTITIATEDDGRLKIKIPPEDNNASLRAKEWFKVIKLLTQDTAR